VGGVNVSIKIKESTVLSISVQLSPSTYTEIVATVPSGSVATLGWNSTISMATALIMVTTGSVSIKYITIIHNADSRGAILSFTSDASISMEV
jgi:hypothetical protein